MCTYDTFASFGATYSFSDFQFIQFYTYGYAFTIKVIDFSALICYVSLEKGK